ncbi:hypothetical protein [Algoriphagus sp. AK58]|uniref:hypothetical protein n=1 Tax=Algoriphagus sp. AK58 TaxID=1406877 RepID=UPI00164F459D|nr:hypothetical protein [Algoriphagus sp. AK58]MBC6367948.1 hypothetical protein [Algoriphagus sp. AK58]
MKNSLHYDAVFFLILLMSLFSCDSENDFSPNQNALLGEWVPDANEFIEVRLDGRNVSLEELGVEVFGFSNEIAEAEAKAYLESTILGPVNWNKEKIRLFEDGSFLIQRSGETQLGSWKMLNDNSSFQIISIEYPNQIFDFEVQSLKPGELILAKRVELNFIGPELGTSDLELKVRMVR